MLSKAIVRVPGRSLINGITTAELGEVDYEKAVHQHKKYIKALQKCGLRVTVLDPDENFADSTFVEDTAVLAEKCAIMTRPGADSRRREVETIRTNIASIYGEVKEITAPGTLEGGDIMRVEDHFYIGLSGRTNKEGASQLAAHLEGHGYTASKVPVHEFLHLKTGVTYIGENTIVAGGEFLDCEEFTKFRKIAVRPDEIHGANCLRINDFVLVPAGCPQLTAQLEKLGFSCLQVDISEFRKVDGGLTCLSLRF